MRAFCIADAAAAACTPLVGTYHVARIANSELPVVFASLAADGARAGYAAVAGMITLDSAFSPTKPAVSLIGPEMLAYQAAGGAHAAFSVVVLPVRVRAAGLALVAEPRSIPIVDLTGFITAVTVTIIFRRYGQSAPVAILTGTGIRVTARRVAIVTYAIVVIAVVAGITDILMDTGQVIVIFIRKIHAAESALSVLHGSAAILICVLAYCATAVAYAVIPAHTMVTVVRVSGHVPV